VAITETLKKKELILNHRYLLHPDSDSGDFFFETGCFYEINLDLQVVSAIYSPKFPEITLKFTAQYFFQIACTYQKKHFPTFPWKEI
jgi:hypothetical protein